MTVITDEMDDAIDDLVRRWHRGERAGSRLDDFLGMTAEQFRAYLHGVDLPGEYAVPGVVAQAGYFTPEQIAYLERHTKDPRT